jgi:hypothetical protein
LVFDRYDNSDGWLADDQVAFLWLTNASNKSYFLTRTGETNSLVMKTLFLDAKKSYLVSCEFIDESPSGSTNWIHQPPATASPGNRAYPVVILGPYSGISIRVPPPSGDQRRKVAVFCQVYDPSASSASQGGLLTSLVWRGRGLVNKLISPGSPVLKVWCKQDLVPPQPQNASRN